MLELTPLEKTVAGQELIQIGIEKGKEEGKKEGKKEGIEKGELIGRIQLLQEMLKCRRSSRAALVKKTMKT